MNETTEFEEREGFRGWLQPVRHALESETFTYGEKKLLEWWFQLCGDFYAALWKAAFLADDEHLAQLEQGFPEEIAALRTWRQGDLARRFRAAGVPL